MDEIPDLITTHPWWIVTAIGVAVVVAGWILVGTAFLERRYGAHMFGGPSRSTSSSIDS